MKQILLVTLILIGCRSTETLVNVKSVGFGISRQKPVHFIAFEKPDQPIEESVSNLKLTEICNQVASSKSQKHTDN